MADPHRNTVTSLRIARTIADLGAANERITGTNDDTFDSPLSISRRQPSEPVASSRRQRASRATLTLFYDGTFSGRLDQDLFELLVYNPPATLAMELAVEGRATGNRIVRAQFTFDVELTHRRQTTAFRLPIFSTGEVTETLAA